MKPTNDKKTHQNTLPVNDKIFQAVYDSPSSLPGKQKWITKEEDVRMIEKLLGMPDKTIGAPLWVSGDTKKCPKCRREINWLDIVSSAVGSIHAKEMIAQVILGETKFVNVEVPRAIANLHCFKCKTAIENIRSFKCHNWAYAKPALLKVLQEMEKKQ
ncbi:hypothetical protein LNQ49_22750 [Flavobacterium sp. F-65]|jgi:hypothetical protein|uniref:Uncharacterized protein n=1 Tax=Flavobacterium pisciphilum TaxID=2893755 RepID=A0ABS8N259_9FLAO|nr:hypothetical protein [Flavobacterium sp. F-65]MCC9074417.1 hypothetical protein [Flavobacterium sp. F-65]